MSTNRVTVHLAAARRAAHAALRELEAAIELARGDRRQRLQDALNDVWTAADALDWYSKWTPKTGEAMAEASDCTKH